MIITISGIAGSGKSTVAKLLAKKLNYKHYSIGNFMREIAKERNLTLLDLSKQAETDSTIDKELDKKQTELGKQDNFVIDSRLGFHFIKNSVKVFLDVSLNEAANRILKEKRQHEQYKDIQDSINKIKTRINSEDKRYRGYYNIDYHNPDNYDILIDTSNISAGEVVEDILEVINKKI